MFPGSTVSLEVFRCKMKRYRFQLIVQATAALLFTACAGRFLIAAEGYDQLVAAAKKRGRRDRLRRRRTDFGGQKGISEIEAAFNKKFGLKTRINFAAGPDMNARAARLIAELKAGGKSSSDFYLGSQSHFALLHKENVLEKTNSSGSLSVGQQGNGDISRRVPPGLHVAERHPLQQQYHPERQSAKRIRGSDRSPLQFRVGRQDRHSSRMLRGS